MTECERELDKKGWYVAGRVIYIRSGTIQNTKVGRDGVEIGQHSSSGLWVKVGSKARHNSMNCDSYYIY